MADYHPTRGRPSRLGSPRVSSPVHRGHAVCTLAKTAPAACIQLSATRPSSNLPPPRSGSWLKILIYRKFCGGPRDETVHRSPRDTSHEHEDCTSTDYNSIHTFTTSPGHPHHLQGRPVMICNQHTHRVTSASCSNTSVAQVKAELAQVTPSPKAASEARSTATTARVLCSPSAKIGCIGTAGTTRPLEPGVVKSRWQVLRNSIR